MELNYLFITMVIGYGFGCLQFSYLLGKALKGIDIRLLGNGNAGASNTVIVLGWRFGVIVGLLDILKAVASLMVIKGMFYPITSLRGLSFLLFLNGLFVIIGHNYPFYMGFKGGKGTASLIGMLLILDYRMALLGLLTILVVTALTDYIALGTICLVLMVVALSIYFRYSTGSIGIASAIAAMSIYKHLPNIERIKKGRETGLRGSLKKKL
ncbi:glycerol-3-phosphate acyltransferase [Alkaliphilus crotonatoxidans]